ncbi:MAG: flagellar brake protein [Pseudomonadota bacterium]|nr:MAG: flagellar brake protein [Pseudomonadota bacterium]
MEEPGPQLAMIEPTALADADKYFVESAAKRIEILCDLKKLPAIVTAWFNDGREFLLTAVLHVDADASTLLMDTGSDAERNRKALAAGRLICVASHSKVQVQFNCTDIAQEIWQGENVFRCALPDKLLRLQRREYERLTTPAEAPLMCTLQLADGMRARINIIDISPGGVAIIDYSGSLQLKPHDVFTRCSIEFPDAGTLTADIEIRNTYNVTTRDGDTAHRAGCAFLELPAPVAAAIERYTARVMRERETERS